MFVGREDKPTPLGPGRLASEHFQEGLRAEPWLRWSPPRPRPSWNSAFFAGCLSAVHRTSGAVPLGRPAHPGRAQHPPSALHSTASSSTNVPGGPEGLKGFNAAERGKIAEGSRTRTKPRPRALVWQVSKASTAEPGRLTPSVRALPAHRPHALARKGAGSLPKVLVMGFDAVGSDHHKAFKERSASGGCLFPMLP